MLANIYKWIDELHSAKILGNAGGHLQTDSFKKIIIAQLAICLINEKEKNCCYTVAELAFFC